MATSGTSTFNLTRDEIINEAAINAGILDPEGQTLTSTQITSMAKRLNTMVKAWQNLGLQIWERKFIVLPLQSGKQVYALSPTTNDPAIQVNWQTSISVAANSGAGTITVTNVTGLINGMGIGIQLSSGTWFFTSINGAPAGNVVTLTTVLSGAANQYATVMAGPKPSRPTRLLDGYLNQAGSGSNTPIRIISKEEYMRFGQPQSTGTPVQIYYDPQLPYGYVKTYPVMNTTSNTLFLEALCLFEDFAASGDNPDFPQEWLMALIWGLSYELSFQYGMTETRLAICERTRDQWVGFAGDSSQEPSVMFQPDYYVTQGWHGE